MPDRVHLTNEELLLWLRDPENHFVERKSYGDWKKDALKTIVAFANSSPIGYPAVLFIGVRNNGQIEPEQEIDTIQKTFSKEVAPAYPPIYYETRIVRDEQELRCLAIVIPGSDNRPHFAGRSFVRIGSETREGSEAEFENLIAQRNNKVYELRKWKDKAVTVAFVGGNNSEGTANQWLVDCNQFFVTTRTGPTTQRCSSHTLSRVELSYDHMQDRLMILVCP